MIREAGGEKSPLGIPSAVSGMPRKLKLQKTRKLSASVKKHIIN
jgi:hypothetical protein